MLFMYSKNSARTRLRLLEPRELFEQRPRHPGEWGCRGPNIWAMLCAARDGNVSKIQRLLKKDPNLVRAEFWYTQPIHFAVREGHLEAVRVLLDAGADPTWVRYAGEELATVARDRGHENVAKFIEEERRQRNVSSEEHEIHRAADAGNLARVRSLVETTPSVVHLRDPNGRTPLHRAVQSGDLDTVRYLVDHGADVDALQASGNVYVKTNSRPVNVAFWRNSRGGKPGMDWMMIGFLLGRGAKDSITLAAAKGSLERVKQFLNEDPKLIRFAEPDGTRPLTGASMGNHLEVVNLLLTRGADPNWPEGRNAPGGAALWWASRLGFVEVCKALLEKGADPNAGVESGGSAIGGAKDKELRALMYRYGGKLDANDFGWEGNIEALAPLAEKDPEGVAHSGCGTIFTAVVSSGNWNMLHMLLKKGVRVPKVVTGCRSYLWRKPEMTRVLLEHGMDPNLPDWQNATPLHNICTQDEYCRYHKKKQKEWFALVDLFLEFGANINAIDEEYRSTPLGWAARFGLKEMVELLLKRGAHPNRAGASWATPLAWAEKRGHKEIAAILRKHGC